MKNIYLFCFLFSVTSFFGCTKDDLECVADITVASLDAPQAVISGNPVKIICVIRNVVQAASDCGSSGNEVTATVTEGYSPTFQENFSDYKIIRVYSDRLEDDVYTEGQRDEMEMKTDQGPGYYAMKVEVDSSIDNNRDNDARAVAVRAD